MENVFIVFVVNGDKVENVYISDDKETAKINYTALFDSNPTSHIVIASMDRNLFYANIANNMKIRDYINEMAFISPLSL